MEEAGGKISDASGEQSLAMYAFEIHCDGEVEPHWDQSIGAVA